MAAVSAGSNPAGFGSMVANGLSQRIVTSISLGAGGSVWIGTYGRVCSGCGGIALNPWIGRIIPPTSRASCVTVLGVSGWVPSTIVDVGVGRDRELSKLGDGQTAGGNVVAMFDTRGRMNGSPGRGVTVSEG